MTSTMDEENIQLEKDHYMAVRQSFILYSYMHRHMWLRMEEHFQQLDPSYSVRLPQSVFRRPHDVKLSLENNQAFLDEVIQLQDKERKTCNIPSFRVPKNMQDFEAMRSEALAEKNMKVEPHFSSKVRSTLHQLVRDWSEEGAQERDDSYGRIRRELARVLPVTASNITQQRVLVPGAGLGRLVLELVCDGYACQGNEFSYQMLFVSNLMLNGGLNKGQLSIHPFVDTTCNHLHADDMARSVHVPDINVQEAIDRTASQLSPGMWPNFSMTSGEWIDVYRDQQEEWDCIVTCFFIDTAPIVVECVEAIYRLLKKGGIWINLGPLLYHWTSDHEGEASDERYNQSIELSREELIHVIKSFGFELDRSDLVECTYTRNQASMMYTVYRAYLCTAIKPV